MLLFVHFMVFVLGLCVGSFINMLIFRTAVKYKLKNLKFNNLKNKNRSFCDFCGRQLGWYENVPVISWLVQAGMSKCCRKKLPLAYPLIELGTGILFMITNYELRITNWWQMGIGLVMVTLMWFSTLFDIKYMVLPDFSTIILILIAGVGVIFDEPNIIPYLLSGLGMAGLFWGLNWITKGKGMGMGDVKLAFFVGIFLGWPGIVVAFYTAFLVGAVVGVVMVIIRGWKKSHAIPFGPFMLLGTIVAWWWGKEILRIFNL